MEKRSNATANSDYFPLPLKEGRSHYVPEETSSNDVILLQEFVTIAVYDVRHSALSACLEMAGNEHVYEQVGQDYLSEGEDAADVWSSTHRAENVYTHILMDMASKEEAVREGVGKERRDEDNGSKGPTAPGRGKSVLVLRDEAPFKVCISRSVYRRCLGLAL